MTETGQILFVDTSGAPEIEEAQYCWGGLHIYEKYHWEAGCLDRKVERCDGSCKGLVFDPIELSEVKVAILKEEMAKLDSKK